MFRILNRIIALLIFVLYSIVLNAQLGKSDKRFIGLVDSELKSVQKAYDDCLVGPCYGDSLYLKNWLDGLNCEKEKKYQEALKFYSKAYHCERYELSTYDIEYSLGRLEIRLGNTAKGKDYLNKFITNATQDLNNEYSMWGFTEDAEKELNSKIDQAKVILNEY